MKKATDASKKKYMKPRLRIISIAAGVQTLGSGCKLWGSSTIGYGNNPCTMGSPCSSVNGS